MEHKRLLLWRLFCCLLRIGAFTFGGGHVMIPVIKHEIVDRKRWLNDGEFMDCVAVVQSSPGPLAVNMAVIVGYRLAGVAGIIVGVIGASLPSFIVIIALASLLITDTAHPTVSAVLKGIKPAVVGLIVAAAWRLGGKVVNSGLLALIMVSSFLALMVFGVHPIIVLLAAGLGGLILPVGGGSE